VARLTPDENSKIHIVDSIASVAAPTIGEIGAGTEVTPFLTPAGLDTPEEGNDADVSSIASAHDLSVPATISGQPSGEFYRDDGTGSTTDDAWDAMARGTSTNIVISRFGGSGASNAIATGDTVEVWPVRVSSRSNNRLIRGEALRFVAQFAKSVAPTLTATVAA